MRRFVFVMTAVTAIAGWPQPSSGKAAGMQEAGAPGDLSQRKAAVDVLSRQGRAQDDALHDAGSTMVLGHEIASGGGVRDRVRVLDLMARHPFSARFISHKLTVGFTSDSMPSSPAIVDSANFLGFLT